VTLVVVAVIGGLVALGGQAAIARLGSPRTTTTVSGTTAKKVIVVRGTDPQTTQAKPWVDLAGATTSVTVPTGMSALILARFTTEDRCEVGAPDICTVRILIGGIEAEPASGTDFAFDSAQTEEYFHAGAMDRSLGPLGAGTYAVQVQYGAGGINIGTFTLDDWSLTVEVVVATQG
jgi:hypothetical protein